MRGFISLRWLAWKQAGGLEADVELTNFSLPKSEEKTESCECCSSWWCLVRRASEQCLAVLREDTALQSNLSKMVTKELWPENHSKMQTSMCGTLRNAGIALRNLQLGFHCDDRLYPLCIWMAFRVSSLAALQIYLGSSFSPFTPLTSVLGKEKYETVNCYAICQFIRSLGRQPHFFSYLLPCHIHLQWVCMTQKPPIACGEMPYIVLCWFFSEEDYTFPCCAT